MSLEPALLALASELGDQLKQRGLRVATAESCTGGLVAAAITAIPGSSSWFEYGFVSYANAAKQQMLAVPEDLLRTYGAVSEPVAAAMAEGALLQSGADLAVAVTGVAGPSGGTVAKPVGMVCFGWATRDASTRTRTCQLAGDRSGVRADSVRIALQGLIDGLRWRAR